MIDHLRAHWHHHTALWAILAASIIFASGAGYAVGRHFGGGYHPAPLPPPIQIGGNEPPASWSLGKFVVRIHNQGSSNSCVGQTLATIEEIMHRERHPHQWRKFSAGYIWNQLNFGVNQGITYPAAFGLLAYQGDSRLHYFRPDGATSYFVQPSSSARREASHHRVLAWRSISPWDWWTMKKEITAGRPLAVAIPVTDSFLVWGTPYPPLIAAQSGSFHYWHSVTAIGYNRLGLVILNSYGPTYGNHGRAILSWSFLGNVNAAVTVAYAPPKGV